MKSTTKYEISSTIKPYLNEIADKLWSSHATIMVGAGFSKNSSENFPDWNALGDIFYKKLYGEEPEPSKIRYANVLKLADGVEAALGRVTLDKILKTEIPNLSVEPSTLHSDLLLLPWTDVFTTNYDTLLERAASKISLRRYDIVVSTEELIFSNSPRIIKLHGSFPSKTPFIITEEDYRSYPDNFAPFVNTVQQSLLENMLCLVGFSGDDPNFLNWIGWIRDNLGQKKAPKIFLVGLFSFTDAQLKLFEKRNIIVVNMGLCDDVNDHWSAMDAFFNYLKAKNEQIKTLNWPKSLKISSPNKNNEKEEQILEVTKQLNKLREAYPGWIIAPYNARTKIWWHIKEWLSFLSPQEDISLKNKVLFVKELIWFLDICLCPIFEDLADLVIQVVAELEKLDSLSSHEFKQEDLLTIRLSLKIALIRHYREEYKWNDWESLIKKLSDELQFNSNLYREELNYEQCLGYFFRLDFKSLSKQLNSWNPSLHLPIWQLRKAGLVAELGDLDKAEQLTQQALLTIRKKLNLSPIKNDLSLLSQESYAMMTLHFLNIANNIKDELDDFNNRWQKLAIYKCDPRKEFEFLDLSLRHEYHESLDQIKLPAFDIGIHQIWQNMNIDHAIKGYNLLRFFESTGLPVCLHNVNYYQVSVTKAVEAVVDYSPLWANFFTIRLGNAENKILNKSLGRKALLKMSSSTIIESANIYIDALKRLEERLSGYNHSINNLYGRLAAILPEVLSRLVSRLPFIEIQSIYTYACQLLGSNIQFKYNGLEKIFNRVPKVVNKEQASQLSQLALNCRCPKNLQNLTPPIWYFQIDTLENIVITAYDFEYSLSLLNDDNQLKQKWGLLTLVTLYEAKVLSQEQSKRFGECLWKETEQHSLPQFPKVLCCVYLNLPSPEKKAVIKKLVKEEVLSLKIPITGNNKSYTQTNGDIPFFNELLMCHREIDLTQADLEHLLVRLVDWWDKDKANLIDNKDSTFMGGNRASEFQARFTQLVNTLCHVLLPKLNYPELNKTQKTCINRLISELEHYNFDIIKLKVSSLNILELSEDEIANDIIEGIISSNEKSVMDACNALEHWLNISSCKQQFRCMNNLANKVLMRGSVALRYSLEKLNKIIKKHPEQVPSEVINAVVNALHILKLETQLTTKDTESTIAEKLFLREAACQTAFEIFSMNSELLQPNVETLITWKDVCNSDNEFNEIKRIWK
ncbi:MAG: SIR2 family protein [Alteromonadaceae bacterium]|nr:SIR2 family protein [Alteromonadaceae bacterium]